MIKVYYPKERIDIGIGQTKVVSIKTENLDYRAPFKYFYGHPNPELVVIKVLGLGRVKIKNKSKNVVMLIPDKAFYGSDYKIATITAEIVSSKKYNLPITARQERALVRTGSTLEDLKAMSVEDLEAIKGISKVIAKRIYNVLHSGRE